MIDFYFSGKFFDLKGILTVSFVKGLITLLDPHLSFSALAIQRVLQETLPVISLRGEKRLLLLLLSSS